MSLNLDNYFNVSEAAAANNVNRNTYSAWIKRGIVPCERHGRNVYIEKDKAIPAVKPRRGVKKIIVESGE